MPTPQLIQSIIKRSVIVDGPVGHIVDQVEPAGGDAVVELPGLGGNWHQGGGAVVDRGEGGWCGWCGWCGGFYGRGGRGWCGWFHVLIGGGRHVAVVSGIAVRKVILEKDEQESAVENDELPNQSD